MELQTLRNFIEIADHGSITAAARTLGISQPGLSRQLKDLEKELGVKLLIRGNRRVTLTEDGTYLLNRARELTAIAERTKANMPWAVISISVQAKLAANDSCSS